MSWLQPYKDKKEKNKTGVPGVPAVAHSVHKDVDSTPGLTQWVKNLVLPQTAAQVTHVAWIRCCHGCGVVLSCSSNSTPSPGTSTGCRFGPKTNKQANNNNNKKNPKSKKTLSSLWLSGLRIQHCHGCGERSIPGPGTSACHRQKKKKKNSLKIVISY